MLACCSVEAMVRVSVSPVVERVVADCCNRTLRTPRWERGDYRVIPLPSYLAAVASCFVNFETIHLYVH